MQHERLADIKWLRFSRSSSQTARRHNASRGSVTLGVGATKDAGRGPISRVNKSQSEMRRFLYRNNGFPIREKIWQQMKPNNEARAPYRSPETRGGWSGTGASCSGSASQTRDSQI